jgi:hypothetical protein
MMMMMMRTELVRGVGAVPPAGAASRLYADCSRPALFENLEKLHLGIQ